MSELGGLSAGALSGRSAAASVRKSAAGEEPKRISSLVDDKLKSVVDILKSHNIDLEEFFRNLFRVPESISVGGHGSAARDNYGSSRNRSRVGEIDVGVFHRMLAEFVVLTEDMDMDRVVAPWNHEIYDQVRGLVGQDCNLQKAIPVIRLYLMVNTLIANLNIQSHSPLHFAYVKNHSGGFTVSEQADLRKSFTEIFRHGLEFAGLSRQLADTLSDDFDQTRLVEEQYLDLSQNGESLTAELAIQQASTEELKRRKADLEFLTEKEQEALRTLEEKLNPRRELQKDLTRELSMYLKEVDDLKKLETRGSSIDVRGLEEELECRRVEAERLHAELMITKGEYERQKLLKSGSCEFGKMLRSAKALLSECTVAVGVYQGLFKQQDELRLKHAHERSELGRKNKQLAMENDAVNQRLTELDEMLCRLKQEQQQRKELLIQIPKQGVETNADLVRKIDVLQNEFSRCRSDSTKEENDLYAAIQVLEQLNNCVYVLEQKTTTFTGGYASINANALKTAVQSLTEQIQEMA